MRRRELLIKKNCSLTSKISLHSINTYTSKQRKRPRKENASLFVWELLTNTQLFDQFAIFDNIPFSKVLQQTLSFTNEHQQCAPASVIFTVFIQVLGKLLNPISKKCHLALGRASVSGGSAILSENLSFLLLS